MGAFGWQRVLLDDRHDRWFGHERAVVAEGRAAARRRRNPIHILPSTPADRYAFDRVSIISTQRPGTPLHRANLAGGPSQAIVIPDESAITWEHERWERFGARVEIVHLALPGRAPSYHFRLIATIALAEIARQVGQRAATAAGDRPLPPPIYDRALDLVNAAEGETIDLGDLAAY